VNPTCICPNRWTKNESFSAIPPTDSQHSLTLVCFLWWGVAARKSGKPLMTTISNSDLTAAIRALEAKGLPTTHQAVLNWLAQRRGRTSAPAAAQLEPTTERPCEAEPHERKVGPTVVACVAASQNKRGRPPRFATWFPAVAKTMADGTALRMALLLNSVSLSNPEIRRLYRLVEFRRLYRLECRMYQLERWGRIPQDGLERTRKRLLARIL
jgi:hypothetical protein